MTKHFGLLLLALLAGTTTFGTDKPAKSATSTVELSKTKETILGFVFHPPKDWKKRNVSEIMTAWVGNARKEDEVSPMMLFTHVTVTDEIESKKLLEATLRGIKKARKDWKAGKIRETKINGLTFLTTEWSGINVKTNIKMKGAVFTLVRDKVAICVSTQDADSHAEETLMKAKAALATFKKK